MVIFDKEFGEIKIRRSKIARSIRLKLGVDGRIHASMPYYAPETGVKRLVQQHREELRDMLNAHNRRHLYQNGQVIGKSHSLLIKKTDGEKISSRLEGQQIVVRVPRDMPDDSAIVQGEIRKQVAKVLRIQAQSYLPRRVDFLASQHGFSYQRLRFSHTGTRWGSCSSSGTISLNIGLMNLPFHLIDYVIIHELCHTRQMNHSRAFWAEVGAIDENYKAHVEEIKGYSPEI